jgi:propanol-preferring alcohol dehydrogenase
MPGLCSSGLVKSTYSTGMLEDINSIFDRMIAGKINGRIVMEIASE